MWWAVAVHLAGAAVRDAGREIGGATPDQPAGRARPRPVHRQCCAVRRARTRTPQAQAAGDERPADTATHSKQNDTKGRPTQIWVVGGSVTLTTWVGEQRKPSVVFGLVREVEAQDERAAHRAPARELSLALLERQSGSRVADGAIARVALRAELSAAAGLVASGVGPDHWRAKLEHVWVRPLEHTSAPNTHHPRVTRASKQQQARHRASSWPRCGAGLGRVCLSRSLAWRR
eukprot:COSAG01_NODE_1751_length_9323_cov_5.197507_13_plen_232_part_00